MLYFIYLLAIILMLALAYRLLQRVKDYTYASTMANVRTRVSVTSCYFFSLTCAPTGVCTSLHVSAELSTKHMGWDTWTGRCKFGIWGGVCSVRDC